MKTLTADERQQPEGYYEWSKSLPFLGSVESNVDTLVAGEWTEIILTYTVGASGLADGAWIKGTFKFYSDWALFQTSDRTRDNYISAEYEACPLLPNQTAATVQELRVRFDQKGHERPFQKAVIVDIVDGYLNPGDKIVIRLGDRRYGAKGTRSQTYVESDFRWRFYIDPVGTSRFAAIQPDLRWRIVAGPPDHLEIVSPRLVQPDVSFSLRIHAEDIWGNVTQNLKGHAVEIAIRRDGDQLISREKPISDQGWSNIVFENLRLSDRGKYTIAAQLKDQNDSVVLRTTSPLTINTDVPVPRILFGDLHVHSDDTVGTENSLYNFSYGRDIAGLDVLGYTANDFQISQSRWQATLKLIEELNRPGSFVIYPGTEWCGNSAAGGDHNVVFLDPTKSSPEFPFDQYGNVARSFEWSEDGPATLTPGAWPLDEVYATYAHHSENHLMIPHVGGRRCNLAWHHPQLERLVEIGSAWGQFEWLLRDAVKRDWKMGVCANSDEHRGRCGGGVPGTAVFGTRGGLTGIISPSLDRASVATALRARHTFATTGPRLVALVTTDNGHIQGDEVTVEAATPTRLKYHFLGTHGFRSIEAFDASGRIFHRDLWRETEQKPNLLRVTWGGARLYDRYREAVWAGDVSCSAHISSIRPFGGITHNPEDSVSSVDDETVRFSSRTSGDIDGVHISFDNGKYPETVSVRGTLGGYVKVGDPLKGHPHAAQPTFELKASWEEICQAGGKALAIAGGAELFVALEAVPDVELPKEVEGEIEVAAEAGEHRSVYFVGREWSGDKVVSSPVFLCPRKRAE